MLRCSHTKETPFAGNQVRINHKVSIWCLNISTPVLLPERVKYILIFTYFDTGKKGPMLLQVEAVDISVGRLIVTALHFFRTDVYVLCCHNTCDIAVSEIRDIYGPHDCDSLKHYSSPDTDLSKCFSGLLIAVK